LFNFNLLVGLGAEPGGSSGCTACGMSRRQEPAVCTEKARYDRVRSKSLNDT